MDEKDGLTYINGHPHIWDLERGVWIPAICGGFGLETATIVAIAAVAASAIGTGVGVYSSVANSNANAEFAKASAKAAEVEATAKQDAAAYEEEQFRRRAQQLLGKQRAVYAASGYDLSSGSPLFQELDTVRQAEIEALNIRRGGDVAAAASRFESGIQRARSSFYSSQIGPSVVGGLAQGTGSILSAWMKATK